MAEIGHTVVCADIDEAKIALLHRGKMPIYESGLADLVKKNVDEGRLSFTTDVTTAIRESEAVFNAVGTPEDEATGQADLRFVMSVAETFGKALNGYKILINKSTVPVGTADKVAAVVRKASGGKGTFDIVSNPEFLREGAAVKDFLNPDRIVVGVATPRAQALMEKMYRPLARTTQPILFMDVRSAEITKYASNAFLATKISFINEIANFCEAVGGNVKNVAKGMGYDVRIGSRFLSAGIGYGGSCFPKDVQALIQTGKQYDREFRILRAVDEVNDAQKSRPIEILKAHFDSLEGKKIAVWGLSFKPRTDDVREAPALAVIRALIESGAEVSVFDPIAAKNAKHVLKGLHIAYAKLAYDATDDVDALVIATEWDEFRMTEYAKLKETMRGRVIVDGRNILDRREAEAEGFVYYGVGV
jgi:UDPglucose 6-dehydrogenase